MSLSASAQSSNTLVTWYAGALSASVDGPLASARFDRPAGLAFDQSGNLYVADSGSHTLRRISPDGKVSTIAGLAGVNGIRDGVGSGARFSAPDRLAVDHRGNVYVATTSYAKRVQLVTPNGVVLTVADEPALFDNSTLSAIALDSADNLYLSFEWPGVVRRQSADGTISTYAGYAVLNGRQETGTVYRQQLGFVTGIAFDVSDNLYVNLYTNILKITPSGSDSTMVPQNPNFAAVPTMTCDSTGTVYVPDNVHFRVAKITSAREITTLAGTGRGGYVDGSRAEASFTSLQGIALNRAGDVFVSENVYDTIRKIAPDGSVSTYAGDRYRTMDGPFDAALFRYPGHMVITADGSLFVAQDSAVVRRVDASGQVSTVAGNSRETGSIDGAAAAARFGKITGLAIDADGTLYVSDGTAKTIRKISSSFVVSTIAGGASTPTDGTGTAAGFYSPRNLALDHQKNIYVADGYAIRRITPDGMVTTFAGMLGPDGVGYQDGPVAQARFQEIRGLAIDAAGSLFVAGDGGIRKITPDGVTTFAGRKKLEDPVDGIGAAARIGYPVDLTMGDDQNLYFIENSTAVLVRKITATASVSTIANFSTAGVQPGVAANAAGDIYVSGPQNAIWKITTPKSSPVVTTAPQSASASSGASLALTGAASGSPPPRLRWQRNGLYVTGLVGSLASLADLQPGDTGLYSFVATSDDVSTTSAAAIVGLDSRSKVLGSGLELQANIVHPNGKVFDQVLLTGAAESVTSDHTLDQVTRTSFIDLQDDIVQVEFSGPGTLSLVLENATGPAAPVNYNQADVSYMKGHAGIVITGADERTNVSVFTVGRATAFDPTGHYNFLAESGPANDPAGNGSPLFTGHQDTAYDGIADIAFIAISTTNGKFGGVRTSNAHYSAYQGITGLYAPGVNFQGPVFVGNVTAFAEATAALILGSAPDVRITGGDMAQGNAPAPLPVQVKGITSLRFTAGADSAGRQLPAQKNRAVYKQGGNDVTGQIVVNPP